MESYLSFALLCFTFVYYPYESVRNYAGIYDDDRLFDKRGAEANCKKRQIL